LSAAFNEASRAESDSDRVRDLVEQIAHADQFLALPRPEPTA
jgi:hypothetical protein